MTAQVYEHLPTEIQAVQWLGRFEDFPASWRASGALMLDEFGDLTVITGKGPATARHSDYVLFSKWDEYWPIPEVKFLASYRPKSAS
jgi:hypothetical protein